MIQTGEARNDGNTIWTNIKPLVDTGSLDLLSDTLDCPLIYALCHKLYLAISSSVLQQFL